jgi:hypothetical protein
MCHFTLYILLQLFKKSMWIIYKEEFKFIIYPQKTLM